MKMSMATAVAGRLMRQLIRDRRACALIILAPLLIMTLLAVIIKSDDSAPAVAISAGADNFLIVSAMSSILEKSDEIGSGFIIKTLPPETTPENAVRSGIVDAVLVIPDSFIPDRASGKKSSLTLVLDGADPMRTAAIFSRFRKTIPDSMSDIPKFVPAGCDPKCLDSVPDGPPSIQIEKIYGKDIDETTDFFTPVLPPFFVFFFVFLISGLSFLRERTGGTAEKLLASPLKKPELVAGYIIGFMLPALVQASIVILFSRYVLGGPWGGWVVVITTLLLCLVAECLGVFVSAFARSEFQVMQFIPIIILPQALLCGMIWPVSGFPVWLRPAAYIFPLTYAVDAIRDTAIRGLGFSAVWHDIIILIIFTVISTTLAAVSVRRVI